MNHESAESLQAEMETIVALVRRLAGRDAFEAGTGVSSQEVAEAEEELGVKFEAGYAAFLRAVGYIDAPEITLYGLGEPSFTVVHITRSEWHDVEPELPRQVYAIWPDGMGNHNCLWSCSDPDYSPGVFFWCHDDPYNPETLRLVAPSFTGWLIERLSAIESEG